MAKTYKVWLKDKPHHYYYLDAPSKRIARWCAAAVFNLEYITTDITAKDFKAERYHYMP